VDIGVEPPGSVTVPGLFWQPIRETKTANSRIRDRSILTGKNLGITNRIGSPQKYIEITISLSPIKISNILLEWF
jgi:hypothetical protein